MKLSEKLLSIEDLSVGIPFRGGAVRAVDGVSLSLERGKTLAIVGESGCGKSTLCRAIMGILPSAATVKGRINFFGRDLSRLSQRELNEIRGRRIGIVFQDPLSSLNPVMKISAQIGEPMAHHLGMTARQARERAISLLGAVGIQSPAERIDSYPHQLSGGMRQRVAIAIALACDPELLIADEPTTALDASVQTEILNLLGRLQEERNMGMILVTHDLGVVAGRAHETAVMYGGRIVEYAPTGELFRRMLMPYTKALFDAAPRLDDSPHRDLPVIAGAPPNLASLPDGCRFAPRCARAREGCLCEEPPLVEHERKDHRYACWFPLD